MAKMSKPAKEMAEYDKIAKRPKKSGREPKMT